MSPERIDEALARIQAPHTDFGATLAAAKLAERHDTLLSVETLRQRMIGARIRRPCRSRRERAY